MSTTTTTEITAADVTPNRYHRTRGGRWVVFGPLDQLQGRDLVLVAKANGRLTDEVVDFIGRPFDVDGVDYAYAYPLDMHYDPREDREWVPACGAGCRHWDPDNCFHCENDV